MLLTFAKWLEQTPLSNAIQAVLWLIPAIQTLHILAIATVLAGVTLIDLRIFGLAGRRLTLAQTAGQYLPWIWRGLLVLALTGATLIVGEPVRSLINPAFQAKMLMLVVAITVTVLFQRDVRAKAAVWDFSDRAAPSVRAGALVTSFVWLAIAVAGRWIAYEAPSYAY